MELGRSCTAFTGLRPRHAVFSGHFLVFGHARVTSRCSRASSSHGTRHLRPSRVTHHACLGFLHGYFVTTFSRAVRLSAITLLDPRWRKLGLPWKASPPIWPRYRRNIQDDLIVSTNRSFQNVHSSYGISCDAQLLSPTSLHTSRSTLSTLQ
jgi:hypothetical protein